VTNRPGLVIIDVTDATSFGSLPPCSDTRFDHRSCDYWEDQVHGQKAARASWWQADSAAKPAVSRPVASGNPFAPKSATTSPFNPFAPAATASPTDLWSALAPDPVDDPPGSGSPNPFAPAPKRQAGPAADAPRKLRLLTRGQLVFGSYAKVLQLDGVPVAFAQFGPLSAYPRAQRIRDLYPSLPSAPLPAVITCVSTTAEARGQGLGQLLVGSITADLAGRGFAAVEAYPDLTLGADEGSAANPRFWQRCGFLLAVTDERYPVMRIELG
jgi:GNAT superfamily N-acetyltransferase